MLLFLIFILDYLNYGGHLQFTAIMLGEADEGYVMIVVFDLHNV